MLSFLVFLGILGTPELHMPVKEEKTGRNTWSHAPMILSACHAVHSPLKLPLPCLPVSCHDHWLSELVRTTVSGPVMRHSEEVE